jgi:hypothetical protein
MLVRIYIYVIKNTLVIIKIIEEVFKEKKMKMSRNLPFKV